jgi:hypothetical protein
MEKQVEHRGDSGSITEKLAPVVNRPVGRENRARPFVAAHDDFEQVLGGCRRKFSHSQVVDNEQRNRRQEFHLIFASLIDGGIGEFTDECVGFTIEHTIALLNGNLADGEPDGSCQNRAGRGTRRLRVWQ